MALQILFEFDLTGHEIDGVLRRYSEDMELPEPVREYTERLVNGVKDGLIEIDERIGVAAPAFPVSQLPAVDRNILRVAIYELSGERGIPFRAVINEAVELAKLFGGENSSRFVNGVLRTISTEERRETSDSDV